MATQQLYRRGWIGFLLLAMVLALCPGCARDATTPDRLGLESDNPVSGLTEAQAMAAPPDTDTWSVPDESNAGVGESAMPMGYREPTESDAPPTEAVTEDQWSPEPMGDSDDSGCLVATSSTTNEDEPTQMIADMPNPEMEEPMQTDTETPNTESDEASGLVDHEDSAYREEVSPPAMIEEESTPSSTDEMNNEYGESTQAPIEMEEEHALPPAEDPNDNGLNPETPGTDNEEPVPDYCSHGQNAEPMAAMVNEINNNSTLAPPP